MNRDVNGLQLALRKSRAQRLIVDTVSGTILGYADIYGKTGEPRPQVVTAIAHRSVSILTIDEYLRLTRSDNYRSKEAAKHPTAAEWYRDLDLNGGFERILGVFNMAKNENITNQNKSKQ